MKRKFLLLIPALMLVMSSFSGCEQKSLENLQEEWVWTQGNANVTLNLYPTESKFYSTVENINSSGVGNILFPNNTWVYYKMVGDTMYTRKENENFPDGNARYGKWLIHQHTEQYLEMEYAGTLPTIPTITNYLFNSQN
jgi:hypothetical protein